MDATSLQCCGTQATLAPEQQYASDHCLDEESIVEKVLVVSFSYYQQIFSVPSCNTPYLSSFLEAIHVDRSSLDNQSRRPVLLCLPTFANEPFLF